jgi:DNA-binding NarL/FixJ family response regulator
MEVSDRTERLLALILLQQMKASPQRDKILQLSVAGFSNTEIADLLQTTSAVVAQSLYEVRRGATRRGRASRR